MPDLSVLIPARQEMFTKRTVEDVLANSRADTEVIVVLDGAWAEPPLDINQRVKVIYHPSSIGQRAATNEAAKISEARFVMKLDAHCALSEGFDVSLIEAAGILGHDVTQIPTQKNLHAFDWMCDGCGKRTYQGPTPKKCECGGEKFHREMVWRPRRGVTTTAWRFDSNMQFQYWGEFSNRPEGKGDFPETLTSLGACFFMERSRFWELGGLDEGHGSWGQFGVEIACKSWLSGGRQVTNRRCWFAHMFRTQGGDFGFPYPLRGSDQEKARKFSRNLWLNNAWPGQKRSLKWLIEHFAPVPTWDADAVARITETGSKAGTPDPVPSPDAPPSVAPAPSVVVNLPAIVTSRAKRAHKGVVFYSDCRGDETILEAVRKQIKCCCNGYPIVSATLAPLDFGKNIVLPLERGYLTMFKQILAGLEALDADIAFLCEHDVLYHRSHFDFVPPRNDVYYYNVNTWKVDAASGRALHYITRQTSGLCADRGLLVEHYRKRVERVAREGFSRSMGFEPGTHRYPRGVDSIPSDEWRSPVPNVDIRHGFNLTPSRWSRDKFRNPKACLGWTESDAVPGWGTTKGRFDEFLRDASQGVSI